MAELPAGTPHSPPARIEPWEVLDLLTALVQKSLVVYEEDGQGGGRYRLLETVRQYARDRLLEVEEGEVVRERHRGFFLRLAEQAVPELHGPDQVAWFDRLEAEHDNMRAALEWLAASSQTEGALRLAGALRRLWSVRGYSAEGRRRLAEVLALPGASEHPAARATALYAAGILAAQQGDCTAARSLHERSLGLRRQLQDREGMALSLIYLGQVMLSQGDHAAAQAVYKESLALGREMGDRSRIAFSLHGLGQIAFFRGDYDGARVFYEESLALRRELDDKHYMAFSLDGLADVARCERHYDLASRLYAESLSLRQELADKHCTATSLYNLGKLAAEQGNHPEACALYLQSLGMRWEHGERLGVTECLEGLAGVLAASGQTGRAARLFGAAARLREAMAVPLPPAERVEHDHSVAALRSALGEAAFAAAWAEGRALSLQQAVEDALGPEGMAAGE